MAATLNNKSQKTKLNTQKIIPNSYNIIPNSYCTLLSDYFPLWDASQGYFKGEIAGRKPK